MAGSYHSTLPFLFMPQYNACVWGHAWDNEYLCSLNIAKITACKINSKLRRTGLSFFALFL